jgi:hypothetical protein
MLSSIQTAIKGGGALGAEGPMFGSEPQGQETKGK